MNELIKVTQQPVIIQNIEAKSWDVERKTKMALHLVVSPETLTEVKKVRAELNGELKDLNEIFKTVKGQVLAPWLEVEEKWKTGIKDKYAEADRELARKIHEVEDGITGACEEELKEYFAELIQAEHIEWLKWEQLGIKIGLTEAKQKTHKKLRETIAMNVTGISQDVTAIADHEDAEEIMAEYKQCLALGEAIGIVQERHKRIQAEKDRKAAWEEQRKAEQKAVERVEAVTPIPTPVPAPAPAPVSAEPEKVYKCAFTVHATKAQLKKLKEFMIQEGIRYE